jgi:hypothetical protein
MSNFNINNKIKLSPKPVQRLDQSTPLQQECIELGLTLDQVSGTKINHVALTYIRARVNAMADEADKASELQNAYNECKGLHEIKINALRLGLNRAQVTKPNFNYLITKEIREAIDNPDYSDRNKDEIIDEICEKYTSITGNYLTEDQIKYFNQGLSKAEVAIDITYEMVIDINLMPDNFKRNNIPNATIPHAFRLEMFTKNNTNQSDLTKIKYIKILISSGGGYGHQNAPITLMKRLRELGFLGSFSILIEQLIGKSELTLQKIGELLPELKREKSIFDGHTIESPTLGSLHFCSMPAKYLNPYQSGEYPRLFHTELTICAANDYLDLPTETLQRFPTLFNTKCFISINPPGWHMGKNFIITQNKPTENPIIADLPPASETRSSSFTPIIPCSENSYLLELCKYEDFNTQLIYGVSLGGKKIKEAVNQLHKIIEANLKVSEVQNKPTLLILPEPIETDDFAMQITETFDPESKKRIEFIDHIRQITNKEKNKVFVLMTGFLPKPEFDSLILATSLPPIVEGANTRETCEMQQKPFIPVIKHETGQGLQEYDVESVKEQYRHIEAFKCLCGNEHTDLGPLVDYMLESLDPKSPIHTYHAQRSQAYQKRPDIVTSALDAANINYLRPDTQTSSSHTTSGSNDQDGGGGGAAKD